MEACFGGRFSPTPFHWVRALPRGIPLGSGSETSQTRDRYTPFSTKQHSIFIVFKYFKNEYNETYLTGGKMKFIKKTVTNKRNGIVNVYMPVHIPKQLRYMEAADYHRVILGNSEAFEFLRDIFLIVSEPIREPSIFYIPDNSEHVERFQEWFRNGTFHMDFVLSNYHSFCSKPKNIKLIIQQTKRIDGETIDLSPQSVVPDKLPYWKLDGIMHFKSYSKYILCSTNRFGFLDLAREANSFVDYEDEETYMCEGHRHLGYYRNEDRVQTDFWYYYQSLSEQEKTENGA